MIQFKRPMLAAPLMLPNVEHTDENILQAMKKLSYPVLATLKKDGIRALRLNGSLLSRTLKPIPNKSIRERSLVLPGGFDMELWNHSLPYDQVESIVMSREHPDSDKIEFHMLDWVGRDGGYSERADSIRQWVWSECANDDVDTWPKGVYFQQPQRIVDAKTLFCLFSTTEQSGGEGICFRTPDSPYKQGRSTLKEQYLVKLCRNLTGEATVIALVEQQENTNPTNWNKVGMMDRSSCQDGMIGKNTLGAFIVENELGRFSIGTGVGLTDSLRKHIWQNRQKFIGTVVKYKHKPHGRKEAPRSPIFLGFRNKIDII